MWNKSYNALVGLYFSESTPEVNNAFLGGAWRRPIGVRLAKPVDRDAATRRQHLVYYGSRYGEYLGMSKLGKPDDFLPAILEESPASASGYLTLADYYAGTGDTKQAIAEYEHTLELSPNRPDVYDSLAVAYYKQDDRAAALARWKLAFATLSKQLDSKRVPESFWRDFGRTCDQLHTRHLFAELKPDADAIVRYVSPSQRDVAFQRYVAAQPTPPSEIHPLRQPGCSTLPLPRKIRREFCPM